MNYNNFLNMIISKNFHFTIEKDEDDGHENKTWIDFESLEQRKDKLIELFDYMDVMWQTDDAKPDESNYYHDCKTYEDFEKKRDEKLVKKYGNDYKPYL